MEIGSRKKCCNRHSDQEWNTYSIQEKKDFICSFPEKISYFFSIFEGNSFNNKEKKNRKPDEVGSTKRSRIKKWKDSKECSTKGYKRGKCNLISFANGIEHFTFFFFGFCKENSECLSSLDIEHEDESCADKRDDKPEVLLEFKG